MIKSSWLSYKNLTIAGNGDRVVNVTGSLFQCKDSTAQFEISYDGGEYFPMEGGLGFRLEPGDQFKELRFRNTSSDAITVSFYAGRLEVIDSRLGKSNSATYLTGHTSTTINAGASIEFTGTNANGDPRKQIVVTNLAPSGDLRILDSDNNVAATVPAGQAWTVETGGSVQVKNPNAGAMNFNVAEIWYDL